MFARQVLSADPQTRRIGYAKSSAYFRIARTLPHAGDLERGLERCEPIQEILDNPANLWPSKYPMTSFVYRIRDQMGKVYGGSPISAASKFLWLRYKDPFVIYDSQARRFLGTRAGDYEDYVMKWEASYNAMKVEIQRACNALLPLKSFLSNAQSVDDKEYSLSINQRWFERRVHDIFLWEAGK